MTPGAAGLQDASIIILRRRGQWKAAASAACALKAMLRDWDTRFPGRIVSMATALKNVVPSHRADSSLFDFRNVSSGTKVDQGDIVFDTPELPVEQPDASAIPIGIWRS